MSIWRGLQEGIKMKRYLSILIIILMISTLIPSYAVEVVKDDISGHWAESTIRQWQEKELIKGYPDGTFKPDSNITKAEFITLVNRIYGYYIETDENYTDISESLWYSSDCKIAKANGYMDWYQEDLLNPIDSILREEVFAILATIMQVEATEDLSAIATIEPQDTITRAEAVTMLDRVMGELINETGTYGTEEGIEIQTIAGNLTVNTQDVILQNMIIQGDLILAAGIADGDVELNNVTVNGRTIINGGGKNSITITGSNLGEIRVYKIDGQIRVVLAGSKAESVILQSGGKLEGEYKGTEIIIDSEDGQEIILNGNFESVVVDTEVDIQVMNGSYIKEITFNAAAEVTGKGKIIRSTLNVDGVNIEQKVEEKKVAKGVDDSGVKISSKEGKITVSDTSPPKDFIVNQPISSDNGKNNDGKSRITITWIDSSTPKVDHYEIVAKVDSDPHVTDVVPGQDMILTGTETATFEWVCGENVYIAVVAVDRNGQKTLCKNSTLNVTVANDTPNSVVEDKAFYDKNGGTTLDIAITLNGGNTILKINDSKKDLVENTDYTLSGSKVTLTKEYMQAQSTEDLTLTFIFSAGDSDTTIITVSDTSPPKDFIVNQPTSSDNGKNDDGKSSVTITWTDSSTPKVDHYEIVAKVDSDPHVTDVVPGQDMILTGTETATFEWECGENVYVAVVAVDNNGQKTLCKNTTLNVTVANDTLNSVVQDKATYLKKDGTTLDIAITFNDNTIQKINDSNKDLENSEYILSNDKVTLTQEYLQAQLPGDLTLTFTFSAGDSDITTITILNKSLAELKEELVICEKEKDKRWDIYFESANILNNLIDYREDLKVLKKEAEEKEDQDLLDSINQQISDYDKLISDNTIITDYNLFHAREIQKEFERLTKLISGLEN